MYFRYFDKLLDLCEIKVTKSLILSSGIHPEIFLLEIFVAKKSIFQLTPHLDKLNFPHFLHPTTTLTDPDRTSHQYCSQN